jgi:hypothetical protein
MLAHTLLEVLHSDYPRFHYSVRSTRQKCREDLT